MLRSSASDDTINTISTTLLLAACSAPQAAEPQQTPFRQILGQSSFHTSSQRLIFHAVLRGLYEDGVRDDVIARLTRTDAATGMPYSFVYACPVCMPAFNALRVYAARPAFYGDKMGATTFGPGLPGELRARLLSEDGPRHRAAIQEIIGGWLAKHIDAMKPTPEERTALDTELEELSEKGLAMLRSYLDGLPVNVLAEPGLPESTREYYRAAATVYADWESCPSCDGASEACDTTAPTMGMPGGR